MRNLKKILALVLALVMSLSLMAVANAAEFPDSGDVSDVYAESVDVLTSLKVFQGNKGNLLPKDNITRAEVAAIIYRIATGDVEDTQKGIYADYNKFSDVTSDAWYAGYVNYCANAEYVKGVGGGKFAPQQNVTGYEALAMILRAIGYDKNNEFTGPSWQIQTAATAKNRHITDKIAEGTLGGPATREVVAEILCKTILVPVADYSLAFGYRTTDANGKDNETLAKRNFDLEKISGVVLANEYAALDADTPLPAGQTKLELADDTTKTLEVASDLDAIGESRYVYVVPKAGTTRFDLVCSKLYGEENNNVYDNEGAKVASVGNSIGSANGITSIDGAEHFVNFAQANEYATKIRIKYVMRVRMSQYDAMVMYNQNGNADNSMLRDLVVGDTAGNTVNTETDPNNTSYKYIKYPTSINTGWDQRITSSATHTYEYTKVIPAFTKLSDTDWANLQSIFANADRNSSSYIVGEVYVGTSSNTAFTLLTLTGSRDISDYITWEKFVADYIEVKENKTQVTECGLGQHLKIVDNDNDGVAEYVLKTVYTAAIVAANGTSLDVSGVRLVDSKVRDEMNSTALTTPFFSTEGLAAGDVVIYALIDGKIHATKAEGEVVKINTVNRASTTATATGEDGKTWSESDVHTHSAGMNSGVTGMVGNTTYNIYFDLYGNLACYTEGANGGLTLITNGWYNNTISGPEYAIQAYVDGSLQTVNVGANGSLFVGSNNNSSNTWNRLKYDFGANGNINNSNNGTNAPVGINTIVANLDGNVLTPVDKTYLYSQNLRMLDMKNNVIPGRDNANTSWGLPYETSYGLNATAYTTQDNGTNNDGKDAQGYYEVRALSNTVYYTVYKNVGNDDVTGGRNVVVRTYTGYNNVPNINRSYIEDVYAVGAKAVATTQGGNRTYYTAQVVVIELNSKYNYMADSEQVFVPEFTQVTNSIGIEDVTMVRGNGELVTVQVDMTKSDTSDYYDIAGGTTGATRRTRVPGLYFMDPSDSNANVYVIKRMTPRDVRANNYLTGYVRESWNVLSNNYAQVELMARPDGTTNYNTSFGSISDITTAQNTRPVAPANVAQLWESRAVTEASKMYTFGGALSSFKESDAAEVLNQNRLGQACGTKAGDVSGLNERWDGNAAGLNFPYYDRNEVLVRYGADGNVIWAVSFNETSSAQQVWWNYLMARNESSNVKFWDVADGDNGDNSNTANTIQIDYNVAKAAYDAGKPIVDVSALGASVVKYEIRQQTAAGWTAPFSAAQEDAAQPDKDNGATYRLEITMNTGNVVTYTLIQNPASATDSLVPGSATAKSVYWDGTNLYLPDAAGAPGTVKQLDLDKYIETFAVSDYRSSIKFEFWRKTMPVSTLGPTPDFTVEGVVTKDTGALTGSVAAKTSDLPARVTTEEIAAVRVTVTAENNVNNTQYSFVRAGYSGNTPITQYTVTYSAAGTDAYKLNGGTSNVTVGAGGTVTLAGNTTADVGTFYAGTTVIGRVEGNGETVTYKPTANVTVTFKKDQTVSGVLTTAGISDADLQAKFAAASTVDATTGVITLTDNIALDADEKLALTDDLAINLNGKTISIPTGNVFEVGANAELTITGNGMVKAADTVDQYASAVKVTGANAVVNVTGATLEGNVGVNVANVAGVELNITNTTINSDGPGVYTHGNSTSANVTIVNSTITSASYLGLYLPSNTATINVSGGKVAGQDTAIEIKGGTLNLTNVALEAASGSFDAGTTPPTGGSSVSGAVLAVKPYAGFDVTVNVNGGTFTGANNTAVAVIGDSANNTVVDIRNTQLTAGNIKLENVTSAKTSVKIDNGSNLVTD